ncbi:MAG: TraR/DksA family transcriptional regulator [Microbacterium gubbeenense]|uniref:TraR/DksA family transcriptional regulator n=1 Tax=Microbacterium gubbeenense TaxID=159896 RepID=UPI0003FD24FC|nr:TraR/DksA family transcriptional regulator [Microbacterium gubbeenense]
MDDKRSAEFRDLLEEHRERVLHAKRRGDADLSDLASARSAATADDEHDPEGATLSEEWARLAGLDAEAEAELLAIDRSLGRIDDGTYGVCADCGKRIPVARLRVRPTATKCVDCASKS